MSEKRTFANITDATSMILVVLNFRSRRLRDFICGLQGVAGARLEFDCTHLQLARRLDHNGKQETAETFVSRYLDALEKEQRRTGKLLFGVERGGGLERRPTRYVDYITPVAVWVVQQARTSPLWNGSHTRAMAAFVPEAVEKLPSVEGVNEEMNANGYTTPDEVRIARNRKHAITRACANFTIISDKQGDVIAHAESLAAEILERARLIAQKCEAEGDVSAEGVQICTPSEDAGDAGRGTNLYPFPETETQKSPEKINMLASAIELARRGWRVFPLHWITVQGHCSCKAGADCPNAGKHPRISEWQKLASADESWLISWWRRWPDANIGIVTGASSNLIVLDIDPRHGGDASITELLDTHGELPETSEAATGGGGVHILFAHPGITIKNSAAHLGEGLDVRGDGGFIVAAPSLHASGRRYAWVRETTPAPAPEWLLKLLTEEKRRVAAPGAQVRSQAKSGATAGDLIAEGNRNDMLFKIGSSMRGGGAEYDDIEAQLLEVNTRRCSPALPVDEVLKIARSVMRYAPNRATVGG